MPTPDQLENRKTWAEALRSGAYKQTIGRLKRKEEDGTFSHCCLGVLAECMNIPTHENDELMYVFGVHGEKNFTLPKNWFRDATGFRIHPGFFSKMNDDDYRSFSDIAATIADLTEAGQ